jgi:hypothetical protein
MSEGRNNKIFAKKHEKALLERQKCSWKVKINMYPVNNMKYT